MAKQRRVYQVPVQETWKGHICVLARDRDEAKRIVERMPKEDIRESMNDFVISIGKPKRSKR